ncbi:MAG: hypothetical protein ACNA8W_20250, partial [Bradymonadaceae bacterium]
KVSTEAEGKCPFRDDGVQQFYCYIEREEEDGFRRFRILIPHYFQSNNEMLTQISVRAPRSYAFEYELRVEIASPY